jgi:hypothetical protein
MAEEKSGLDKFRDLYLPTVREYEKKLADTLSYYAGPELTKIGQGIKALLPFQNIPDSTEFIQEPSLKNFGKLASDTAITAAELTPFGYLASRSATLPGKVAQEVTSGIKPIDEITGSIKPIDEIKSVAQGGKFGEMSDDFVNYYANITKQGAKDKYLKIHNRINEFFQTPRKITENPYEGLGLNKSYIEKFIRDMGNEQWFKNKNVQDNWASWRTEKQARSGSSQLLEENTEKTYQNIKNILSKKSEKELLELQDNVTGPIQLHGIFNKAFKEAFGHAPAYTGGKGFGHIKTYKVIRELNKKFNLNIPESYKTAMMPINQAEINKLPIGNKLSSDQARKYLRNLSTWKTQSITDKLFNKNTTLSKVRDDIDNLLIEGKRPYEFDHIQSFIFGGGNDVDNISVLLVREHRGTQIPIKEGLDVIKSKTKFEQNIHKKYMNIIDEVKKGNIEEATKITNQVDEFISNTIANKPSYSFIIDQPYTARKLAQEGPNKLSYVNEIDYLVKQKELTIDQANQIKSLIKRVEYTPDYAKVFRSGEEGFVDKMQSAYNTLKEHAGAKRKDIKKLSRKDGGIVGISHLTRPLGNF